MPKQTILSITHSDKKARYDFELAEDTVLAAKALVTAAMSNHTWFEVIMNATSFIISSAQNGDELLKELRKAVGQIKLDIEVQKRKNQKQPS